MAKNNKHRNRQQLHITVNRLSFIEVRSNYGKKPTCNPEFE